MFCKLKTVALYLKIITTLLLTRPFCLCVKGLNLHIHKCQARWNVELIIKCLVHTAVAVIGLKMK